MTDLTRPQTRTLQRMYDASQADPPGLIDPKLDGMYLAGLRGLQTKRLVKDVGQNLWRITLGGIAYVRTSIMPIRSEPDQQILQVIRDSPGITSQELYRRTKSSPSTVRKVIARLRASEWVSCQRDENNSEGRHYPLGS